MMSHCCSSIHRKAQQRQDCHAVMSNFKTWAAQYNTWLLNKLMPKGVVIYFLLLYFASLCFSLLYIILFYFVLFYFISFFLFSLFATPFLCSNFKTMWKQHTWGLVRSARASGMTKANWGPHCLTMLKPLKYERHQNCQQQPSDKADGHMQQSWCQHWQHQAVILPTAICAYLSSMAVLYVKCTSMR